MPRSNRPEQIRRNAIRSRWLLSMPACTLNTRPASGASIGRGLPSSSSRAAGGGARSTSASSSRPTPTPISAAPNSTGVARPARKSFSSNSAPISARRSISSCAAGQCCGSCSAASSSGRSSPRRPSSRRPPCGCSGAARRVDSSTTPRRSPAMPSGQVTRHGPQPDRLLHLVEQLERLAARAVPLVHERDHGDAAGAADVEQLEGLRLQALRGVEQHHRGVDGGEHAVGVLGEVAVAGGVEQVDHAVAVGELQHRRA